MGPRSVDARRGCSRSPNARRSRAVSRRACRCARSLAGQAGRPRPSAARSPATVVATGTGRSGPTSGLGSVPVDQSGASWPAHPRCASSWRPGSRSNGRPSSGAGGLGTGFATADFRIALAVDVDRHAAQTYRFNHPGVPVLERQIDGATTADDLQSFPTGLERCGRGTSRTPVPGLLSSGAAQARRPAQRAVQARSPPISRTSRARRHPRECAGRPTSRKTGHSFLPGIREKFERAGYRVRVASLDASEFGVPQRRKRYFLLIYDPTRVSTPETPSPTHVPPGQEPGARAPDHAAAHRSPCMRTAERSRCRGAVEWPAQDRHPQHGDDASLVSGHREDPADSSRRRADLIQEARGGPSARTIIAGHRALPVHPRFHRAITVREAAVIQGFDLTYRFLGPCSEQPLQVANAVPPPLAAAVARELRLALDAATADPTPRRAPAETVA